jgi:hypothetical protein
MQFIYEWGHRDDGTVGTAAVGDAAIAQMMPERVDFEELLAEVDEAISQVPQSEQLRLAGEALLRMAEVYAARSETWIEEWEQASRDPVVERGFFDDLVRQTMAVDLSELMEPAPLRKQRSRGEIGQEGAIVAEVEKDAVLAMVDQMEAEAVRKEAVLAHPEGSALRLLTTRMSLPGSRRSTNGYRQQQWVECSLLNYVRV